jgi:hypothetical protein
VALKRFPTEGPESLVDDWWGIPRIAGDYFPILVCCQLFFIVARRCRSGG